jgi:hypothetical protein
MILFFLRFNPPDLQVLNSWLVSLRSLVMTLQVTTNRPDFLFGSVVHFVLAVANARSTGARSEPFEPIGIPMRLVTSLAIILASTVLCNTLTGQTAPTQKQTLDINGSVWMKNPFNDREMSPTSKKPIAVVDRQKSKPAEIEHHQPSDETSSTMSVLELPEILPAELPFEDELTDGQSGKGVQFQQTANRAFDKHSVDQSVGEMNQTQRRVQSNKKAISLDDFVTKEKTPSFGPLDQSVRKASAIEEVTVEVVKPERTLIPIPPSRSESNATVSYSKPITKVTVEQTGTPRSVAPRNVNVVQTNQGGTLNSANPESSSPSFQQYGTTQHYDSTSHLHDEARFARENFDPANCNHQRANNPDISGCHDEWGNFCNPRRLDWECNCRQFPRRENQPACGCQTCRTGLGLGSRLGTGSQIGTGRLRQGIKNLACGCRGKCNGRCRILSIHINTPRSRCGGPGCTQASCGCQSGQPILGAGVFKPTTNDTPAATSGNPYDFGNAFPLTDCKDCVHTRLTKGENCANCQSTLAGAIRVGNNSANIKR